MKRIAALLLCLSLFAALVPASAAGVYSDVPADHWAYSDIIKAKDHGLMEGYGDGLFGLGDSLRRADFTAIICRMFGWELISPASPAYIDCPTDQWYYPYVETAAAHGVRDNSASFRPYEPLSREEMAIMLVQALGYDQLAQAGYQFDLPFADVTKNQSYIALAWQVGLARGLISNGQLVYHPDSSATREEAATMLVRVYERYISKIDWLHGFYAISSYSQIGLTLQMDAVSLGWARLEVGKNGAPLVNTTSANGNGWVIPDLPGASLGFLEEHNVPYNLNIFSSAASLLADPAARAEAIAQIVALSPGYAGITMDFEALRAANKDRFTAFMTELRAALPADKTLYVCVTPVVPDDAYYDGYDYRALGEICDKVILMAHDYQYTSVPVGYLGTTLTNSPLTPFNKIYYALAAITDEKTGVADRSKLALAISFGSVGWRVDQAGRLLEQGSYHPSPSTIITRLRQANTLMGWSEQYRNPYIYYTTESGARYRLWYEDERSVMDKVTLAKMFGITGVSLWRLGNVPTYDDEGLLYDVWGSLLAER